ncbi:hypothetical protein PilKf_00966 [Pillotina sp. SPG140]|jgi:hypothetical protein
MKQCSIPLGGIMIVVMIVFFSRSLFAGPSAERVWRGNPQDTSLRAAFNAAKPDKLSVTIGGDQINLAVYREICYVANPISVNIDNIPNAVNPYGYQSMNIYIPEKATADSPIYFLVTNHGWFASYVADIIPQGAHLADDDNIGAALKAGYIVVNVGTRSRGITAQNDDIYQDGDNVGKAPSVVVDAKAAVRFLRLIDDSMPGSAERIIVNGTSGGGGLVTALGASGNSPDYYPYLAEIGASGMSTSGRSTIRDDIFAVIGYCPISDFQNADMAYEWFYQSTRGVAAGTVAGGNGNKSLTAHPGYTQEMIDISNSLKASYPAYQTSLGLTIEDGTPLTADTMEATIVKWLEDGFNRAIVSGLVDDKVPWDDWGVKIDASSKTAKIVDLDKYKLYVATSTALKTVPAFDNIGVGAITEATGSQNENNLFGQIKPANTNFTRIGWENNPLNMLKWNDYIRTADGKELVRQLKMINPLQYINTPDAKSAPYWYIRHGGNDRDTVFTVSINLYYKLLQDKKTSGDVKQINYALPYNTPHSGDYDIPEKFAWIQKIVAEEESRYHP